MHKDIVLAVFLFLINLMLSSGVDYYQLLGVSKTADQKDIRKAFKKLAVLEHPDKNNDNPEAQEKFILLTRAYETLKDPDLRRKYDMYGEEALDNANKKETYHSWHYYGNIGIYDNDPQVIGLDGTDYHENVDHSEKLWLVNFYSPHCSHCHHLAPVWKKIAKELEGVVKIGAVNCDDEWQLCRQLGIRSYPTLLHYPKNSKVGMRYTEEKTYTSIMDYIFRNLEIEVDEIDQPLKGLVQHGRKDTEKPTLIFLCGEGRNCFTPTDRRKIAAVFENTIDVRIFSCDKDKQCDDVVGRSAGSLYLPPYTADAWKAIPFEAIDDADVLIERILEQLPEPQELDEDDFENIRKYLMEEHDSGWLVCFYIGRANELNLILKRLPGIIKAVKLGKLNCGKYSRICGNLSVNRYPMWGVLKPGGAFELNHEESTINNIIKFSESSIRAKNVWALSAEQISSVLERKNDKETWFLDWYAPWCPPCIQFLREVRKASVEFDKSTVYFGTIDCTVHSTICQENGINSYPTAILINGTETTKFSVEKTAPNIVQFINEAKNPSVVRLTSTNFNETLGRKKSKLTWVVEYFATWCGPCQRLAPEWITVARSLGILPFLKVASIDCEAEPDLCKSQGIRSYPTIRMYVGENKDLTTFSSYSGQRDAVSILAWITQFFPRKVQELDPAALQKELSNNKHLWIINFFVTWCEHCRKLQPQFAIVAQLLKRTIKFGHLNCEKYGSDCARAGVNVYPKLIAYIPGKNGRTIADGVIIDGTVADVIKRNILELTSNAKHDEL